MKIKEAIIRQERGKGFRVKEKKRAIEPVRRGVTSIHHTKASRTDYGVAGSRTKKKT
jgi:hypothetical protein